MENVLEMIRQKAEEVISAYVKLPESLTERNGREGGYLTIKNIQSGMIEAIYLIGCIQKGKEEKYLTLSQEKANRLFRVRMSGGNDRTSWESRNEEKMEYGGAIFFPAWDEEYILSFSGLPELGDEACMFITQALISSKSAETIELEASSILHSIYFSKLGRPGQPLFHALLEAFKIKI
jgi:hypothetical protein